MLNASTGSAPRSQVIGQPQPDFAHSLESSRCISDTESMMSVRSYLDKTGQLTGNYDEYAKIERLRNFEPAVLNQNLNGFVDVLNATDSYWDPTPKPDDPKVVLQISNVAKVDRFIITE